MVTSIGRETRDKRLDNHLLHSMGLLCFSGVLLAGLGVLLWDICGQLLVELKVDSGFWEDLKDSYSGMLII